MGVVWRAVDRNLEREVALKVLPGEAAAVPGRLDRFEREARAVAALDHPHIVTVFSVEEAAGVHFITMELVDGSGLDRLIPPSGLVRARFYEVALPLVAAVGAAHERGIVHRDLKPSNVMIDRKGRLKVLDFGLAKLRDEPPATTAEVSRASTVSTLTQPGKVLGTVPYMSPEQVEGRAVDHRSDIFSLGTMLHEMATGARPFRGSSSAEVGEAIRRAPPAAVNAIDRQLSRRAGRAIRRCLEKEPGRRFATVRELQAELELARRRGRVGWRSIAALLAVAVPIAAVAAWLLIMEPSDAPAARPYTVAVAPFANLTGDPTKDYLAEGISAALITQLGELSGVRVLGRSAGLPTTGDPTLVRATARSLGADALLEGDVQATDRIRIGVRMTATESGVVLHSTTYDAESSELLAVQRQIGRDFARLLSLPLTPQELRRLTRGPTRSFEAYEHFVRAEALLQGHPYSYPAQLQEAITLLREAIRLDPEFALAHAKLSEALRIGYENQGGDEAQLEEAETEAKRALSIDPDLSVAIVARARLLAARGRDADAFRELQRGLEDHSNPAEAQYQLANAYAERGELQAAERCLRAAVALSPDDWYYRNHLGGFLLNQGRLAEARDEWVKASRLSPPAVHVVSSNLASLLVLEGRFEEAIVALESLPAPGADPIVATNLATAYYFSDRPERLSRAEEFYRLAVRLSPGNHELRRNLADLYVETGRADAALEHYREALRLVEQRLQIDPHSPTLRLRRAHYAARSGDCASALEVARGLTPDLAPQATNFHDLAYSFALCGERDAALDLIDRAIASGYPPEVIRKEPEFRSLAGDPRFERLIRHSRSPGT